MVNGELPPFSAEARDTLCRDPDAFHEQYGTHFIKSALKGASIEMWTTITTTSRSAAKKFSAEMEASYSGFGVNVEGSAAMEKGIKTSSEVTNHKTSILIRGADRGADVVESMDIKKATETIL